MAGISFNGETPVSVWPLSALAPSALTVFGSDDRIRVTPTTDDPWRTVTKVLVSHPSGDRGACSGAMLDLFHVLTAGHCVYLHDEHGWAYDSWASAIEVVPAMDDGVGPYGRADVTLMRTYTAWIDNRDVNHDWAVLTLDRCIGYETGWMGRKWEAPSSPIYTGTLHTAGYPGDLDSGLNLYRTSDNGRDASEYLHWFFLDSMGGQSGSPVWEDDGTDQWIVSIITYHDDGSGSNVGTRINEDKFNRIEQWLGEDAPNSPCNVPDLAVDGSTGFTPAIHAETADPIEVWVTVANNGPADAGSFIVAFYLSEDTAIGLTDILLGRTPVTGLASGDSLEVRWAGTVPPGAPDGAYWVGWLLDDDGALAELDEGNNAGYVPSGPLVIDRAPPTGSIVIQGGSPWTNRTAVTLFLSFDDVTSGVQDVRYSNDGTFDDEPWEAPVDLRAWSLTGGDGAKQVWYEVRDRAGHTDTLSAVIGLDTTAPATTVQLGGNRAGGGAFTSDVTISLIGVDAGSGIVSSWYRVDGGIWIRYTAPITIRGDGPHRVEVYSTDRASNTEAVTTTDLVIASSPWSRLGSLDVFLPILLAVLLAGLSVAVLFDYLRKRGRVPPPPPEGDDDPEGLPPPPPPDDGG